MLDLHSRYCTCKSSRAEWFLSVVAGSGGIGSVNGGKAH